jgi:hypothetical protein
MTHSKRHLTRVRSLSCVLCANLGLGQSPAEVHHVFDTAARSDYLTVALCPEHHRGPSGFHGLGQRAFERRYKVSEAQLLAWTIATLVSGR